MARALTTGWHWLLFHPVFRLGSWVALVGIFSVCLPPLGNLSYDLSYFLAWAKPRVSITNTVLVCADSDTLQDYHDSQNKLSRLSQAQLLDRLTDMGAAGVMLDFVLKDEDPNTNADRALEAAIRRNRAVGLVAGGGGKVIEGTSSEGLEMPIPQFTNAARSLGHGLVTLETVRRISLDYRGLPPAAWAAVSLVDSNLAAQSSHKLKRWINYYGSPDTPSIPMYRFHDMLEDRVSPAKIKGRMVFVGQSLPLANPQSFKDTFSTPYTRFDGTPVPGVTIHATAYVNLMRGDWLGMVPAPWQLLMAALWGLLIFATLYRLSRMRKFVLLAAALGGGVLLCFVSLYVQWHFFRWWSWIGPAAGQTSVALLLALLYPRPPDPYIAFLSYRVENDGALALLIRERLARRRCRIFVDVKGLEAGRFDEQLLLNIEKATYFIVILSSQSLARFSEEHDWMRRELAHAVKLHKHVIPVSVGKYDLNHDPGLPWFPELEVLKSSESVTYTQEKLDGFLDRLEELLKVK